jgi:hypothetical protein
MINFRKNPAKSAADRNTIYGAQVSRTGMLFLRFLLTVCDIILFVAPTVPAVKLWLQRMIANVPLTGSASTAQRSTDCP